MKKLPFVSIILLAALLVTAWAPVPAEVITGTQAESLSAATGPVKLSINNKSGAVVTVTLTGPATYTFTAAAGKSEFTIGVPGKYKASYSACGKNKKVNVDASKKPNVKLTIPTCGGSGGGVAKFTVINDTGGTITIVLSGPGAYTFRVAPGNSKLSVPKGKYQYTTYTSTCGSSSGTVNLRSQMRWSWWCL